MSCVVGSLLSADDCRSCSIWHRRQGSVGFLCSVSTVTHWYYSKTWCFHRPPILQSAFWKATAEETYIPSARYGQRKKPYLPTSADGGPTKNGPLKPDACADLPPPLLRSWPLAPPGPTASARRQSTPPLHKPSDAPSLATAAPLPSHPPLRAPPCRPHRTSLAVCPFLPVCPSGPPSPPLLPSLAVRPSLLVVVAYQSKVCSILGINCWINLSCHVKQSMQLQT
jgi:hypothetical protein